MRKELLAEWWLFILSVGIAGLVVLELIKELGQSALLTGFVLLSAWPFYLPIFVVVGFGFYYSLKAIQSQQTRKVPLLVLLLAYTLMLFGLDETVNFSTSPNLLLLVIAYILTAVTVLFIIITLFDHSSPSIPAKSSEPLK